jgi:CPA2 family monovalent cation:H+ antiporter-2
MLTASVMTMILTPFLASLAGPIYKLRKRMFKHESVQTINIPETGLRNHVVIAGGGRVGQSIAKALQHLGIPYLIIELDSHRISELDHNGSPMVFGDASQPIVLEAASVAHSRLVLITTPSIIITQTISRLCHDLDPEICIIARCGEEDQMKTLHDLGVSEVVLPAFEAGLEITRQALQRLGVPPMKILQFTNNLRHGVYTPEQQTDNDYRILSQLRRASDLLELNWILVSDDSPLIGNTVKTLEIRKRMGVSIVGVIHGREVLPNPHLDYRFESNDLLAVMGNPKQLSAFQGFNNPAGQE